MLSFEVFGRLGLASLQHLCDAEGSETAKREDELSCIAPFTEIEHELAPGAPSQSSGKMKVT